MDGSVFRSDSSLSNVDFFRILCLLQICLMAATFFILLKECLSSVRVLIVYAIALTRNDFERERL